MARRARELETLAELMRSRYLSTAGERCLKAKARASKRRSPRRHLLRTLAMPEPVEDWSLTSLKEKLVNIGAKVVSQWRYAAFQISEVAIPRNLFAESCRCLGNCGVRPLH
jgi:hypothetical protein